MLQDALLNQIFLYKLRESTGVPSGSSRFDVDLAAQFEDHSSIVWRVTWNITGTVLASSGDDGCVRLWKGNKNKNLVFFEILFNEMYNNCMHSGSYFYSTFLANYKNIWKCTAVLKGDGTQSDTEPSPAIAVPATPMISLQGTARYYKLGTMSHSSQVPWH